MMKNHFTFEWTLLALKRNEGVLLMMTVLDPLVYINIYYQKEWC